MPTSIGGSSGTAIKSAALVAAPLGLAVLAWCGPRLLPRQLAVLPDGMAPRIICFGMYIYVLVRILGWSCSAIVCHFSGVWFIMFVFVSNHLFFCFAALPRCPCLIPHDAFFSEYLVGCNTSKHVRLEGGSPFWVVGKKIHIHTFPRTLLLSRASRMNLNTKSKSETTSQKLQV